MIFRIIWISAMALSGWMVAGIINPEFDQGVHFGFAVCGLIVGGLLWIFGQSVKTWWKRASNQEAINIGLGLVIGLAASNMIFNLCNPIIGELPVKTKCLLLFWVVFFSLWLVMNAIAAKQKELSDWWENAGKRAHSKGPVNQGQLKILDTSSIIDGRIADLCKTGFLEGVLLIPGFVLSELQKIADSSDPLRRNRGRRGLEILGKIQKENMITVRIFDRDYDDLTEVDTKLLRLTRELEAKVVTNDYNLNKVAELYGVQVLNINDLSNAIKPVVIPGEEMMVHVLRDGKEHGQGIGYLEDGTMIVVEGGKSYIGLDIEILVTSILQTSAGRMIFAKPKEFLVAKVTS